MLLFFNRLIVLALALAFTFPGSALLASNLTLNQPEYEQAVKDYKERKYSQTISRLRKLHETGQCNDMVHYYMALSYQCLNQIGSARQEYTNLSRSKSAVLKNNAQRALAALNQWSQHRLYEGNGNNFSRYSSGPARIAAKPKPITFDIPAPTGGC